ncbi:hypothetical protein Tco_0563380 [Tanacetum coccineum]
MMKVQPRSVQAHHPKTLRTKPKAIYLTIVAASYDGTLIPPPVVEKEPEGNLQIDLLDQGVIDSGCSRHMIGNMSYLTDYKEIDGGYVAFRGNPKGRGK